MADKHTRIQRIAAAVRERQLQWWTIAIGFTGLYYLGMLAAVSIRFGNLPNFVETYDWLGNVKRIVESTPSLRDTAEIVSAEWLMEVGYMNYDFGHGIAEWSLFLLPAKMLGVFVLGALLATWVVVPKSPRHFCSWSRRQALPVMGGAGASLVALSSITLSWVVCCSTPTWVVGMAMMGLSVSAALWLEPIGDWLTLLGFLALCMALYFSADGDPENEQTELLLDTAAH